MMEVYSVLSLMSTSSTYRILLENTAEGKALATVLELPECRVMADTVDSALIEVQQQLNKRLAKTEVVSVEIPNNSIQAEHPMLKFAGIFKDDPDFAAVVANIKKERAITEAED
jgi:predicted RNase H-like HicB family nuclease